MEHCKEEGTSTSPTTDMDVTPSGDNGTPTEKDVASEEMPPRIEKEVNKENESSPVDENAPLLPPIEKVVASEDSSNPTEMEVTKDEASPMVEKNDTSKGATHGDVQSLIEKEVLKVDAVKEVANNEETLDSPKC